MNSVKPEKVNYQGGKALVVFSGGQDSTTCLAWALSIYDEVHALTIDYGQRHKIEIDAAKQVASILNPDTHEILEVGPILQGTSPLVSGDDPEQYEHWSKLPGGLEATFVPARNILFLTLAANRAYCLGAKHIITGVSQEDFGGYPDCRTSFIVSMQRALRAGLTLGNTEVMAGLEILTPLINLDKEATVGLAMVLPKCYEALGYSHTAYDGVYPPTGKDHASLLRAKGFELYGVPDPLVVRAYNEGLMPLPDTENYKVITNQNYQMSLADVAFAIGAA